MILNVHGHKKTPIEVKLSGGVDSTPLDVDSTPLHFRLKLPYIWVNPA